MWSDSGSHKCYGAVMEAKKRGRPTKAKVGPATERISVRLTPQLLAWVDKKRGAVSRAEYLRACVKWVATADE